RIGVQVSANPRPKAIFFQKTDISNRETSLYMLGVATATGDAMMLLRSEEHTSELQSQSNLVCRLLLEKKKTKPVRKRHRTRGRRALFAPDYALWAMRR